MSREFETGCFLDYICFVPSQDGLSRCREEWTKEEDLLTGSDVLYRRVMLLDSEE